jgi:hypothetical protein
MRAWILFLFIVGLSSAHAEENCLSRHLKNASVLNESRRAFYSELTQGLSEPISDRLIAFEKLALLPSAVLDGWASPFQSFGVPVLCDELISMSEVSPFAAQSPVPPDPISRFRPMRTDQVASSVREAYRVGGFSEVSRVAQEWVDVTKRTPSYHCLLRHFLESIVRAANLAPIHVTEAESLGLPVSSMGLSWAFIELQLAGLQEMENLDELAAPIQATGVPLLCQDVPVIPANL